MKRICLMLSLLLFIFCACGRGECQSERITPTESMTGEDGAETGKQDSTDVSVAESESEPEAPEMQPDFHVRELYADLLQSRWSSTEDWTNILYACALVDLDGNGTLELIVFLTPNESDYTVEIYTVEDGVLTAFAANESEIPRSANAHDGRFSASTPEDYARMRMKMLYGDWITVEYENTVEPHGFFSLDEQWYLISAVSSEYVNISRWYCFTEKNGGLAAEEIFSTERYGEFVWDDALKNRQFLNGKEVSTVEFEDGVREWLKALWGEHSAADMVYPECENRLWQYDSPGTEAARWILGGEEE